MFPDSINLRRFPSGCSNYRENWTVDDNSVLYQIYCLVGDPPLTREEQEKCLASKKGCWREREASSRRKRAAAGARKSGSE